MTKKSNKQDHREIEKKLEEKPGPDTKKNMEEIVYGDENNPTEKYGTGNK